MEQFLELVADVFEIEVTDISENTNFREDIEDFSSMDGFSLIVMMEEEYGYKMSVDEFLECETVSDLYKRCSSDA